MQFPCCHCLSIIFVKHVESVHVVSPIGFDNKELVHSWLVSKWYDDTHLRARCFQLDVICAFKTSPIGHLQATSHFWAWTHNFRNSDTRGVFHYCSFAAVAHVCRIGAYEKGFQKLRFLTCPICSNVLLWKRCLRARLLPCWGRDLVRLHLSHPRWSIAKWTPSSQTLSTRPQFLGMMHGMLKMGSNYTCAGKTMLIEDEDCSLIFCMHINVNYLLHH
jgi:hypothetical protein